MYTFLFQAHSGWRWLVLVIIIITTLRMIMGLITNGRWGALDGTLLRLSNITLGVQIILGLLLFAMYFTLGVPNFPVTQASVGAIGGGHLVPAILSIGGVGFASARTRKVSGNRSKFLYGTIGMIITIVLIYGAAASVGGLFVSRAG